MSLLREIQNTLVEPNCDLPSLLRKCKILAYRLGSDEFKTWIENEISGYKSKEELPDYRILKVQSKGHFSGMFGKQLKNAPIPMYTIPEDFRESLSHSYVCSSISAIENLAKNNTLEEIWDSDLVAVFGRNIYQDMVALEIKKIIPVHCMVEILDEVKNRVLNFVLELEKEDPNINDSKDNKPNLSNDTLTQIFHTTINGTVQNLATGSHDFKQIANSPELFDKLIKTAQKIEIKEVSEEFIKHIENMKNANTKDGFKSHYNDFMASLANHATVASFFVPFLSNLSQLL